VAGDIDGQPDVRIVEGQPLPVASESFDAVLSMQVLEHVWDVDWYLRETSRVLRPGGTLVLSTHGVWPYHPHPADYRRWTRVGLLRELESRGFAVEGCDAILAPPAWIAQFGFLAVQRFLLGPAWLRPFRWAHAVLGSFVVRCIETLSPAGLRANDAAVYVVSARKRGML
jgi:SAM-dependent methyltransferase